MSITLLHSMMHYESIDHNESCANTSSQSSNPSVQSHIPNMFVKANLANGNRDN